MPSPVVRRAESLRALQHSRNKLFVRDLPEPLTQLAPRPPRHLRRTVTESRAAMLHGCARCGSATRLRLLPRSVLMGICPNSAP